VNPEVTKDVVYFGEKNGVARYLLHQTEARKFWSQQQAQTFINQRLTVTKEGAIIRPVLYNRGGHGDPTKALETR
ncbi:hypothetical protein, partial [Streptococcus suis]|uniref:hypothetical protein n=1 Tax=Streptococcus suis TaxID=1307 RepID=UPI0029C13277